MSNLLSKAFVITAHGNAKTLAPPHMFWYHARVETADSNPLITVIIPVYNAEKYLRRGLDNLLAQTCGDWEAVCIDDGSTDGSAAVLEEYAARDARFRVLRQENSGVSVARNRGIQEARGAWVTFMDADDWLGEDIIEALLPHTRRENVDVIGFEAEVRFEDGVEHASRLEEFFRLKKEGEYPSLPENVSDMIGSCCGKAYRREFLQNHDITFPMGMRQEDEVFYRCAMGVARNMYLLQHTGYYYYQNAASYMHTAPNPEQSYLLYLRGMEIVHDFYQKHGCGPEWEKTILSFLCNRLHLWYDDFSLLQLRRVRRKNHAFLLRLDFLEKLRGNYMLRFLDHAPWWKDCFVRRQLQMETFHVLGLPMLRRLYPHFQYERSISVWGKLCSILRGEKHA